MVCSYMCLCVFIYRENITYIFPIEHSIDFSFSFSQSCAPLPPPLPALHLKPTVASKSPASTQAGPTFTHIRTRIDDNSSGGRGNPIT